MICYLIFIKKIMLIIKKTILIPIRHPEKIAKRKLIYKIDKSGFVHWQNVEKEVKELKSKIKQTVLQKTIL